VAVRLAEHFAPTEGRGWLDGGVAVHDHFSVALQTEHCAHGKYECARVLLVMTAMMV